MTTRARDLIAHAVDLAGGLADCLEEETGLLRTRRPRQLAGLQARKDQLTSAWQQTLAHLNADHDLLATAPADERQRLQAAMGRFRDVLEHHNRALVAAKTVTERMIRAVGQEAMGRNRPVNGYNGRAAQAPLTRPRGGRPVSLALNQVV